MNRIKELEELILKHKALYYQGRPEISDLAYDQLEEELKKIDPENSALVVVGSAETLGKKTTHIKKMLSLEKCYELNDLVDWVEGKDVVSTLKIDGMSCSLIFENGSLKIAKTRGDGTVGEDITEKIKWMSSAVKSISERKRVEIRGELFCLEENFFYLSEEMVKIGLDRPTSPRNIVAGLMGRKENIELARYINFKAFDLVADEIKIENEEDKFELFKKWKFDLPDYAVHKNGDGIERRIKEAEEFMADGNYQIDGLVFTFCDIHLHETLGETAHHPRYKMAYKFKGEAKETIIESIEWGVSRNGVLTPVALVTPTELSGAMISRVTLHNYGQVATYQLKSGDKIEIIRSGEVIPKFLGVKESSKNRFEIPNKCPSCHGDVIVDEIRLKCKNNQCPGRNLEIILNFVQKIGIDDLSSKRLIEMINKGVISKIPDLYRLEVEDLLKLDKVKEKMASKLYDSIQKTKNVDLVTLLASLGISGGAYNKCERIVQGGHDTFEKIKNLTVESLINVDLFAEKSASDFVASLQERVSTIEELILLGIKIKAPVKHDGPLAGKKICITGALSEKRSVIEKRIRDAGAYVVGAVSKETDCLLTNETDGLSSKFKKAKDLGIKIITEEGLLKLLN